jgi:hypothetical protein
MRAKLPTFLTFTPKDWQLLIQAWLLLWVIDLALRTLPFRKVQRWVGSSQPGRKDREAGQVDLDIRRCCEFMDRAARHHLYSMGCLRRSLTLQWLLYRRGIDADLRFGVRRKDGILQAHAWLEYQGQVIGETIVPDEQYARLKAQGAI